MKRWLRTLSNKTKTAAMVLTLLTAQVAGAALPFMPKAIVHATPSVNKCVNDTAGANDVPNQKDLTRLCSYTGDAAGQMTVSWQWDDTAWTGKNTGDACALFDTDGDGNINKAVCVTVQGNPAAQVAGSPYVYNCNDTDIDNCKGATPVAGATTTCVVSNVATDPFPASVPNGPGDSYPNDTQAVCTVTLADVSNGVFKDVCSYPSSSTPSDPSDCVVAIPGEAKLEVVKSLVPSSDNGRFDLQIDGIADATNVGDGGTTGTQIVTAANNNHTHTIAEAANSTTNATSLGNYSTAVICKDQHGTGTTLASGTPNDGALRSLNVTVAPDSDVVCTFTNTRASGTITVTKVVNNSHGGTATASQFPLFVNATQVTSGATNSYNANQSYTVSETANAVAGYTRTSASCVNTATQAAVGMTFTLGAGQNISCTITNSDTAPLLLVTKHVINDNGGTLMGSDFKLYVNGSQLLPQDAKKGGGTVADNSVTYEFPGAVANTAYTVSEDSTTGYTQQSLVCLDTTTHATVSQPVTLQLGQTVECTITNNDVAPQLTVIKHVVNRYGGSASASDFTMNVTGIHVSSSSFAGNESGTTVSLDAGNYSVGESGGPSGYVGSTSTDCSGTIAVGQTKTCTITNNDQPASISGTKYEVNADGTHVAVLGGVTICLDANANSICDQNESTTTTDASGNYSFTDLAAGTYHLIESLANGWTRMFGGDDVTVTNGQSSTGHDFGNFQNGSISGYKWNDVNGDGVKQELEPKLSDWTIKLYQGETLQTTTKTDATGNYSFTNLAPGIYSVCEGQQTNWVQTYPGGNGCHAVVIDLSGEANADMNFGNRGYGTITVVKHLSPTTDPGKFNLQIDGQTYAENVGDNGTTGKITVPEGTHSIGELAGTGTSLSDYDSVIACEWNNLRGGQSDGTYQGDLPIVAGDDLVCTITNTRQTGTISVTKQLAPQDDNGLFDLLVDGSTKASDVSEGGTTGDVTVVTGTHSVRELAGANTSLDNYDSYYVCTSDEEVIASGNATTSDEFSVGANEHIDCVFTNTRHATLTVIKKAYPVNSNQSFNFTVKKVVNDSEDLMTDLAWSKNFQLDDNANTALPNNDVTSLSPGTYSVTEDSTAGWDLAGLNCGDTDVTINGATATFTLKAGQQLTCTYTNQKHVVPQVLGESVVAQQLTNTGLPIIAYVMAAISIIGIAGYVQRRQTN